MPFLAVDIGNSNVHIGFRASGNGPFSKTLRLSSRRDRTAGEWHSLLAPHLAGIVSDSGEMRIVACSVVPALTVTFVEFSQRYLESEPLIVSISLDLGLTVATQHSRETGTDRIANAVAAFADYGGPVIVVDMGTATKIDAVSGNGEFLGGAIAPGLGLSMDALAQRAAQLYSVPLTMPRLAIGTSTLQAVQSGVVLGHAKMVDGLVQQITTELGDITAVVITGGFASVIVDHVPAGAVYRRNLTLDGLSIIASRNP